VFPGAISLSLFSIKLVQVFLFSDGNDSENGQMGAEFKVQSLKFIDTKLAVSGFRLQTSRSIFLTSLL